jgi:uncharacterized membrane protein YfcA
MPMTDLALYLVIGYLSGILSGLFGIGGGVMVVPALVFLFTAQKVAPEHVMHLAIGTSLAIIIGNSLASGHGHHRRGNVDWVTVRQMAPPGIVGAIFAAWLAANLHSNGLRAAFALFECGIAIHLFRGRLPHPREHALGAWAMRTAGGVVGASSSLLGIGGGTVAVPFLAYATGHLRRAIGTASAIGLPLSLVGTASYVVSGWHRMPELPSYSLGYVYLPAAAGIALAGFAGAPLGVRLAHRLPVETLKKAFAVVLFLLGIKMGWPLL